MLYTHLRGHLKPGASGDRDAAFRGATQIRALSTGVVECRQLSETASLLIHNKHRDSAGLPLGVLTLAGRHEDPHVRLDLAAKPDALGKAALADAGRDLERAAIKMQKLADEIIPEANAALGPDEFDRMRYVAGEIVLGALVTSDPRVDSIYEGWLAHPRKAGWVE